MSLVVDCPWCSHPMPFRRDKRGGRYLRCNDCQFAFFFSGRSVIDALEGGGTWTLTVKRETETDDGHSILDTLFRDSGDQA